MSRIGESAVRAVAKARQMSEFVCSLNVTAARGSSSIYIGVFETEEYFDIPDTPHVVFRTVVEITLIELMSR